MRGLSKEWILSKVVTPLCLRLDKMLCAIRGIESSIGDVDLTIDYEQIPGSSCENPSYVELCTPQVDFEYKEISRVCYQCDGQTYYSILCQKYENGVATELTTILTDGTSIIDSLPCTTPCNEDLICDPWLGGGSDDIPTQPITDLTIILECNCSGVIETSIGDIPFDNISEICIPTTDCSYTVNNINTTCSYKWYASRKS